MMSVGVLVTNYNSWPLALACVVEHRRLHGGGLARILLLDDCSTAPPPDLMLAGFELLRNERNLGFAASLNRGVRALGTDLVVIFDADAFPLTPYLDNVRAVFEEDPRLGLLGFETVNSLGEPTESTLPEPNAASLVLGQMLHDRVFRRMFVRRAALCITTAAMVVRRQTFDEIGGFDERLSWLDVDTDFSMTINRSAWKLRVQPGLVARHEAGGTPLSTAEKVQRFYASRWYLLRKHGLLAHGRAARWLVTARLGLEWLTLIVFGRIIYLRDPTRRRDKIAGRRKLLAVFRQIR